MAAFHSTLQAQIDALMEGGGVIGDVYFATDTRNIFVCLGGGMVPLPNVLKYAVKNTSCPGEPGQPVLVELWPTP